MATGEGISTLLPPTQACSNCCHYCCKLFVFVRFGIIPSLPQNFSTKANLRFIWSLVIFQQQTSPRPEMYQFFSRMSYSHLKVLYLSSAEPRPSSVCFLSPHKLLCCVYHFETATWSWENTKNMSLKTWKFDCRRYKSVLFAGLPPWASEQNNRIDALPETFWERNDNVIVYRSQWGNFPFACPLSRRSWVVNNPLVYSKKRISVLFSHTGAAQSILAM